MANKSKPEMLKRLRTLVREAVSLRHAGGAAARLAHANGAVDGYLRALLDAEICTKAELLTLMAAERAALDGPATRVLSPSDPALA